MLLLLCFQAERAALLETLSTPKATTSRTGSACAEAQHMAATVESRVLLGQCHAEGGITDGCYALYDAGSNAEQVDCVLAQIKVGRGVRTEEGGGEVINQCGAGGLCTRTDQRGEGGGQIKVGERKARGGDQGGEAVGPNHIDQRAHLHCLAC